MFKTVLFYFIAGIAAGAIIGMIIHHLAVGIGIGAILGLTFARRYGERNKRSGRRR